MARKAKPRRLKRGDPVIVLWDDSQSGDVEWTDTPDSDDLIQCWSVGVLYHKPSKTKPFWHIFLNLTAHCHWADSIKIPKATVVFACHALDAPQKLLEALTISAKGPKKRAK